jgi:hypothetical protein
MSSAVFCSQRRGSARLGHVVLISRDRLGNEDDLAGPRWPLHHSRAYREKVQETWARASWQLPWTAGQAGSDRYPCACRRPGLPHRRQPRLNRQKIPRDHDGYCLTNRL